MQTPCLQEQEYLAKIHQLHTEIICYIDEIDELKKGILPEYSKSYQYEQIKEYKTYTDKIIKKLEYDLKRANHTIDSLKIHIALLITEKE
jgi:predicted RNase H-like nuclease (RuvC/YqgF family)